MYVAYTSLLQILDATPLVNFENGVSDPINGVSSRRYTVRAELDKVAAWANLHNLRLN